MFLFIFFIKFPTTALYFSLESIRIEQNVATSSQNISLSSQFWLFINILQQIIILYVILNIHQSNIN